MAQSFKSNQGLAADPKNQREPNWDDGISWFQMPDDDEIHEYRLVGAPYYYAQHWIQTTKRDGKHGKSFPVICSNFDSNTNTYAENGCEVCAWMNQVNEIFNAVNEQLEKAGKKKMEWKELPGWVAKTARKRTMASNVIVREFQLQGPPANNPDGWSFIRQIRFPQGFSSTLREQQEKFNKRNGQVYALNDIAEGPDLQISFNSQAADIKNMYTLRIGNVTPITEEELSHENFLVDFAAHMIYPDQKNIADSLRRNKYFDWLNDFKNSQPTESVPQSAPAPVQNAAPPQAAHQAARAANSKFAAPAKPEPPPEDEPAAQPELVDASPEQARDVTPPVQPAAKPAPVKAAPQPAAAKPAPAQAAPAAAPKSPAPAQNGAAKAAPIESRLQEFSAKFGAALAPTNKTYDGKTLRLYRSDLAVPECWSGYTKKVAENKDQCRGCPLRLDCMMVTA